MKQNDRHESEKKIFWNLEFGNLKGVAERGPENDWFSWNIYAKLPKLGLNDKNTSNYLSIVSLTGSKGQVAQLY